MAVLAMIPERSPGDIENLEQADTFFFADLDPLNNSGAEGAALLALNGDKLTVVTAATGVEPGQVHPQHIHGFEDESESNVPTLRQDDDTDGFVELTEGEETYGPVLLSLTSPAGGELTGFPTPSGDAFFFVETYDLSEAASAPLGAELLEAPLTSREIVLHGITLAEGQGETNASSLPPNEADGTAGYKAVLPIAAGEIEEVSSGDALSLFSAFAFGNGDDGGFHGGFHGDFDADFDGHGFDFDADFGGHDGEIDFDFAHAHNDGHFDLV